MFSTFENSILEVEKLCRLAVVDELLPQIEPPPPNRAPGGGSNWKSTVCLTDEGDRVI